MDYRELLIKYIQWVKGSSAEKDSYIFYWERMNDRDKHFTPEEWAELEALALIAREGE